MKHKIFIILLSIMLIFSCTDNKYQESIDELEEDRRKLEELDQYYYALLTFYDGRHNAWNRNMMITALKKFNEVENYYTNRFNWPSMETKKLFDMMREYYCSNISPEYIEEWNLDRGLNKRSN